MAKRRPNIVDILIIVVILAAAALAVYKFGVVNKNEAAGVAEAAETRTVTAFIDEVRMPTVNALHEGDQIFDEKTGACIGVIKLVSHAPYMKSVIVADGSVKQVEYPDYYSVTLTIESPVIEKEEGYFADGVVELKANSEMNTFTKYGKPVIKVTSISR
ncbi:MAG: DUF4330 family protein [Bacillota bacterium]|nr:DUF4330 family protein [Bacillota bacterium]